MSPNELVTKQDLDSFANDIVERLYNKLSKLNHEKLPDRVDGKWIIQTHLCGIGSYATLSRRVEELELHNPELYKEIVFKVGRQRTQYDPTKFKSWYENRQKEKEAKRREDPRLKLMRGEKI